MTPQNQSPLSPTARSAFTLIELIVVISILAIVAVLIIPTVRTLNEDRKIRDTARVVGAVFAAARDRAAVDGLAGVEIVSIPSNPGANDGPLRFNAPNMGLVLYELRGIPAYNGDALGATVTFLYDAANSQWRGTFVGADVIFADVKIGDTIEINHSGVRLKITDVVLVPNTPGPNDPADDYVVIDFPAPGTSTGAWPALLTSAVPFRIHRQPVRIESSAMRLPNNLFLNMALSGHGTAPAVMGPTENQWQGRQFRDFEAGDVPPSLGSEGSTVFWFSADGSVDQVRTRGFVSMPTPAYFSSMQKPTGPIYLLMANGNDDDVDLTNLDSPAFLQDDNNMWITIDHRTGGVTMGKMAQAFATDTLGKQLQDSRALARNRRSANP